ncbi:helix-turn-helix domain-containing protein [Halobaculum magnesiiphilum]|uniref:Helix-turn-helix domain-containing protein n=1 Tax=Halobaculum magnesiiphilum TaxID=1017351 RepID=A0A8T8WD97_9EURY|nr:helix-turn-helix domain-containing protein [Halobaculum magnesiiphilum]QZP37837.1 helix-turn-helix domain-containing protein [Halobaculum magnesiiphilum]
MATVAEFTVVPGDFPLGTLLATHPEARIRLEQVVPTRSAPIPYFWVDGSESEEVVEVFRDSPDVKRTQVIDEVDGELLVRVEWKPDVDGILRATRETDVTLVSAEGTSDGWTLEVRGDDADAIKAFQANCTESSIPLELRTLHALMPLVGADEYSLTDRQRDALIAAYERGYFDSPQRVTLEELGAEFGITGQSFGSRLRRGTKRLIKAALVDT